jgi:ribosome-interacting GTPase 1
MEELREEIKKVLEDNKISIAKVGGVISGVIHDYDFDDLLDKIMNVLESIDNVHIYNKLDEILHQVKQ